MITRSDIPYWLEHAAVALAIQIIVATLLDVMLWSTDGVTAGTAAGIAFYAGREIRDRQKLGRWDWPGLIAPTVACLLVWGLV